MTEPIYSNIPREECIPFMRGIEKVSRVAWLDGDRPLVGIKKVLNDHPEDRTFSIMYNGTALGLSFKAVRMAYVYTSSTHLIQTTRELQPIIVPKEIKVVYIAGPFRGENAWKVERNIRAAEELAFRVAARGYYPLCPHTMTRFFNGTLTDKFWLDSIMELLRRSDALLTVGQDWEHSTGTMGEITEAITIEIPVYHNIMDLERK